MLKTKNKIVGGMLLVAVMGGGGEVSAEDLKPKEEIEILEQSLVRMKQELKVRLRVNVETFLEDLRQGVDSFPSYSVYKKQFSDMGNEDYAFQAYELLREWTENSYFQRLERIMIALEVIDEANFAQKVKKRLHNEFEVLAQVRGGAFPVDFEVFRGNLGQ